MYFEGQGQSHMPLVLYNPDKTLSVQNFNYLNIDLRVRTTLEKLKISLDF